MDIVKLDLLMYHEKLILEMTSYLKQDLKRELKKNGTTSRYYKLGIQLDNLFEHLSIIQFYISEINAIRLDAERFGDKY